MFRAAADWLSGPPSDWALWGAPSYKSCKPKWNRNWHNLCFIQKNSALAVNRSQLNSLFFLQHNTRSSRSLTHSFAHSSGFIPLLLLTHECQWLMAIQKSVYIVQLFHLITTWESEPTATRFDPRKSHQTMSLIPSVFTTRSSKDLLNKTLSIRWVNMGRQIHKLKQTVEKRAANKTSINMLRENPIRRLKNVWPFAARNDGKVSSGWHLFLSATARPSTHL